MHRRAACALADSVRMHVDTGRSAAPPLRPDLLWDTRFADIALRPSKSTEQSTLLALYARAWAANLPFSLPFALFSTPLSHLSRFLLHSHFFVDRRSIFSFSLSRIPSSLLSSFFFSHSTLFVSVSVSSLSPYPLLRSSIYSSLPRSSFSLRSALFRCLSESLFAPLSFRPCLLFPFPSYSTLSPLVPANLADDPSSFLP